MRSARGPTCSSAGSRSLRPARSSACVAPGETAIVLGGVIAAQGGVDLSRSCSWPGSPPPRRPHVLPARRATRAPFLHRRPALGLSEPRLHRVERFFDRHGAKAILVGRFVGIVRAVSPVPRRLLRAALRASCPGASSARRSGRARSRSSATASTSFSEAAGTLTHAMLGLAVVAAAGLALRAHRRAGRTPDRGPPCPSPRA